MRALLVLSILTVCAGWAVVHELPADETSTTPTVAPQQVQSIALDGRDLPLAALRAALATHIGDQLDDPRLVRDRAALEAALVSLGYLDAKVAAPSVTFAPGGGAFLTFDIAQGALYLIASVTIDGVADRDVTGVVTLGAGDDASPTRIESARVELADNLVRHGKPHAVATHQRIDRASATVDVELAIR